MRPSKQQSWRRTGAKAAPDQKGICSRSVCFTQQQTTVLHGAPADVAPSAVLLGDVDNDPRGDVEVAIGGVDGTLAVFKTGYPSAGPFLTASGLGRLSTLGLGTLLLGHSDTRQLIACTGEGMCHVFNIRPADIRWDKDDVAGRVEPLWSVSCPLNVTSCCIADIDGDNRQEVVMGTKEGMVHVLSMEVNPEEQRADHGALKKDRPGGRAAIDMILRPREDTLRRAYSPSTPLTDGEILGPAPGEFPASQDEVADAMLREARGISELSPNASELHWDDAKSATTADILQAEDIAAASDSLGKSTAAKEDAALVPLRPHFKILLTLRAASAVTSLAIVKCPDTAADLDVASSPNAGTSSAPMDKAGAGPDDGGATSRAKRRSETHTGKSGAGRTTTQAGSMETSIHAAASGLSPAGVYLAVGLEAGGVEVMRLSSRRTGTRHFDLVDTGGKSERACSSSGVAFGSCPSARDDRVPSGSSAVPSAGFLTRAGLQDLYGGSSLSGERSLPRDPLERSGDPGSSGVSPRLDDHGFAAAWGGGSQSARAVVDRSSCDWHVPVDLNAAASRAIFGADGPGLVIGLGDPVANYVSATPNVTTPLSSTFRGVPWGWGQMGEPAAVTGAAGAAERADDEQAFAVCLSEGRIGCCRVVSTSTGRPRWRVMWTNQTEEAFFAFQRLSDPSGFLQGHGQAVGERANLLVACSWSGHTFIFDAEGKRCVEFNPGPFLRQPLSAFVAGDCTTPSGSLEPSLVYVSTGGEVVVYHGLAEQAESMAPTQFLPTLHANGSMDALRKLVKGLAERLRWRSDQEELLFQSVPVNEETASDRASPSRSHARDATLAAAVAATDGAFSDDDEQQDLTLSLPDVIVARAVLSPVGIAEATRGRNRRRSSADGAGGGSDNGGVIDDDRWKREVRALDRGESGTITVGEGAAAAERVLREIEAWERRTRDPTLRNYPCLRETLAALTLWGSGPRRASLRAALKESEAKPDVCASPV